jgi:hypothetical protein
MLNISQLRELESIINDRISFVFKKNNVKVLSLTDKDIILLQRVLSAERENRAVIIDVYEKDEPTYFLTKAGLGKSVDLFSSSIKKEEIDLDEIEFLLMKWLVDFCSISEMEGYLDQIENL